MYFICASTEEVIKIINGNKLREGQMYENKKYQVYKRIS